ncbi:hypothetical protein H0H81_007362 [Sphagnurus paluster]|uniref:Calcineurin-like phosphoesterase domain-containing protein n=1 Tax=Sphagnurus paluster TaxID=117069 RepID=A0A9P7GKK8_9AGAR|nr:hypothetical protein H0H81_007362 [Sphagnurus paluster]
MVSLRTQSTSHEAQCPAGPIQVKTSSVHGPGPTFNHESIPYTSSTIPYTPSTIPYTPSSIKTSSSVILLEYDPETLPPPPSDQWTRFVCISDTHTRTFAVPDGDVLLHSGDLTNTGTIADFQKTMEWLFSLPHKVKIIIAGNHDLPLHRDWYDGAYRKWHNHVGKQDIKPILDLLTGQRANQAGLVYLQDSSYEFQAKPGGLLTPRQWSPYFFGWAFNYDRQDGKALVAKLPKTDILLTHGPPLEIFDRTRTGDKPGCADLRARLPHLRPRLHLFGHIHEARGGAIHAWDEDTDTLLEVQNRMDEVSDDEAEDEDDDDDDITAEALVEKAEKGVSPTETAQGMEMGGANGVVEQAAGGEREETVFVNASCWPAGAGAWRGTHRVPFGGPGFQAVVVDLRD